MTSIRSLFLVSFSAALIPCTLSAASADMQAEYAQVRKIALKDPGVRAAYAKADAKLNARMIEIDPALKPLVQSGGVAPAPVVKHFAPKKPVGSTVSTSSSYVVAAGDTLTSIAARYHVSVAELKSANGVVDERKLRVGQTLRIPAHADPASDRSVWSRMKSGM